MTLSVRAEFDDDSDAEDGARVMAGESEGRRSR